MREMPESNVYRHDQITSATDFDLRVDGEAEPETKLWGKIGYPFFFRCGARPSLTT
jgi:hypothetical protein